LLRTRRILRHPLRQRVRIDSIQQARGQAGQIDAARGLDDRRAVFVADPPVESGQAGRECGEGVVVASAGGNVVDQPVEGDDTVALQRLRCTAADSAMTRQTGRCF
jgi:hypothetical protein